MFILASNSPRRKELIAKLIPDFICISPDVDENIVASNSAFPLEVSKLKAYKVFSTHPNDVVLSCDTVVILNGVIFGKPKDENDARRMLNELSNKTHVVLSGYTIISKDFEINRTVSTKVTFNKLSISAIEEYIKSKLPFDKAGSYGIQDNKFNLVKEINGSFYNVMGLPIEDIKTHYFNRLVK